MDGSVVGLNLGNNGLSGRVNKEIQELKSLSKINLSDNDMKVRGLQCGFQYIIALLVCFCNN